MSISAQVIADSVSPTGSRLTTVQATFHRFILPEVNTHRAFSRNVASNRAIPTPKLIEQVRFNPAFPVEFGSNQPGMQAGVPLNESQTRSARVVWRKAAMMASDYAEMLYHSQVHKQVVNRVLEPYLWTTAIISSTQAGWENFFSQRISPLAQPEINALALAIKEARDESTPEPVVYGAWHVPYCGEQECTEPDLPELMVGRDTLKISAARCARVSYLTHDGKRDIDKDLDLYEKLVTADPPHWSPLEHVATPNRWPSAPLFGNFDGWCQLRHLKGYQ